MIKIYVYAEEISKDWGVSKPKAYKILYKIRDKGFNSMEAFEKEIQKISFQKNELKQEFDKLSWEQKRIKEVVKYIQICIIKREHYEGHRKNPNDKIYMIMNRKDIEAYQKSYAEIGVFETVPAFEKYCIGRIEGQIR